MIRVYLAFVLGAALTLLIAGTRLRSGAVPESAIPIAEKRPIDFHWNGAGSCASMACHGSDGVTGTKGSEYTTWAQADPHSNAYEVLLNNESQQIAQILQGGVPPAERRPAEKMELCLACHSAPTSAFHPQVRQTVASTDPFPSHDVYQTHAQIEDGVSCEACHGGSEKWLGVHMGADWRDGSLSPETKEREYGLRDLRDPLRRATMCLECHSGSGDRQVDHDLIAAGHPRLFFEYSAFNNSPGRGVRWHWHWANRESGDVRGIARARDWAIGQVANAVSALDLLASRAGRPAGKGDWPELAEFDCYACHQDLSPTQSVQNKRVAAPWTNKPTPEGALAWNAWSYVMLHRLAKALEESGAASAREVQWDQLAQHLREIDARMVKSYGKAEDGERAEIAQHASSAARILQSWIPAVRKMSENSDWIATTRERILTEDSRLAELSWDAAAQLYLSLGALSLALDELGIERPSDPARKEYRQMAEILGFPKSLDSPKNFSMDDFRTKLETYRNSLKR